MTKLATTLIVALLAAVVLCAVAWARCAEQVRVLSIEVTADSAARSEGAALLATKQVLEATCTASGANRVIIRATRDGAATLQCVPRAFVEALPIVFQHGFAQ